jgi:hypothetical protein
MPACSVNYVYFQGGKSHTRRPRTDTAYGGLTPIDNLSGSFSLGTGTFSPPPGWLTPTQTLPTTPPTTLDLAFVNVAGGTDGGVTWYAGSTAPLPRITVGSAAVTVMIVYVPVDVPPGIGGGDSGASIDAYDDTLGKLVDDLFITAVPDNGQTASGNTYGWVDTTTGNETITAYPVISPSGTDSDQASGIFERWVNLLRPQTPLATGTAFTAEKGQDYYAFAFYKAPPPLTTCQRLLSNWNALEPKTDEVLLAYYEEKLSACQGQQYAAAVTEIKALLKELQNEPKVTPKA